MMVERLIFFDIDGTLVPDTSTGSFIAKCLGSLEQMAAAERAYEEGWDCGGNPGPNPSYATSPKSLRYCMGLL